MFLFQPNGNAETVTGVILGEKEITIKAKSQGEITAVEFKEGAKVKSGDVIAIIDDQQEEIERSLASAEYESAGRDYTGTKKLKKYVSKEEMLKKRDQYLRKKSSWSLKEYSYNNTRIKSPIDGVISKSYFDKGETVSVGDKVYEVVQVDKLKIFLYVPSESLNHFKVGESISFKTKSHGDQVFAAKVEYISPITDSASGTVKIKLSFDNLLKKEAYVIRPGTMAFVEY